MNRSHFLRRCGILMIGTCLDGMRRVSAEPLEKSAPGAPQGRPRYEILGMLDEYLGRVRSDPEKIESFYPSEQSVAIHFETMLREFCADEGLPAIWERKVGEVGHISFTGRRIAAAINASYTPGDPHHPGPPSALTREAMRSAPRADMLRYLAGAYIRIGDSDERRGQGKGGYRPLFSTANSYEKFCVLTDFLLRLGCTNLRCYWTENTVPVCFFLSFHPSEEVKTLLGIRRDITTEDIKEWSADLKPRKLPRF